MNENLRELRKVLTAVEEKKIHLKQVKRVGTFGVTQLDHDIAVEKGFIIIKEMTSPARSYSVSVA